MSERPPVYVMEDHCDAYPAWKENAFREAACVHLDAHLDLSDEGFPRATLEGILACRTAAELAAFRANPRLPWGGIHAGNYLYPAVLDGTVQTLYWVVPPWLPQGRSMVEWARGELQRWYDMPVDDYASLRLVDGRVEGRMLGRPFTLCTVDRLPRFDGPVLLDIDADYFLDRDDTIFAHPEEILERLRERGVSARSITVSYSVNGGYLPLEHRCIGDLVRDLAAEEAGADATDAAREVIAADRLRARGEARAALDAYERALARDWSPAALHFKKSLALRDLGRPAEATAEAARAAELDSHFRPRALDLAFVHFRRRNLAACLEWLARARADEPEFAPLSLYIEGLALIREQRVGEAVARWEQLVDEPSFRPAEQAYLYSVLGRALYREGRTAEALRWLRRSVEMDAQTALYQQHLGQTLQAEGCLDEAARHLRKSIALDDRRLSVLEAHRHLVEVYEAAGQRALADAERRRLQLKDVLGTHSVQALLRRGRGGGGSARGGVERGPAGGGMERGPGGLV